jgi:hypothetical protein
MSRLRPAWDTNGDPVSKKQNTKKLIKNIKNHQTETEN